MADENLTVENKPEETVVQPTAVELEAMESGWVPKDKYAGDEHKWVEAGEFLRRGELFSKIDQQNRKIKDFEKALDEMKKLHKNVAEVEYKRALESLRTQKKTALEEGDAEAVIAADERIDLIKEQQREAQRAPQPTSEDGSNHPEFVQWAERNNWYKTSSPMKAFADALGADLARAGNSPSEVLRKVEAEVKKEFPHKFSNPNRDKPGAVESSTGGGTSNKSSFVLSDDERRVMNTFIRTGVFKTEKEYIDELKKVRG